MKAETRAAISRRKLLGALALTFAGTAAVAAPAAGRRAARRSGSSGFRDLPLAHAGIDQWTQEVGTRFRIRGENGMSRIELVEVRPLGLLGRRGAGRDRAFAAVFAARGGSLPAGGRIYPLSHPRHGRMDVFFDPATDKIAAIFA
jgi:hypothetical protein